jgi:2-aminoadipate transaminase
MHINWAERMSGMENSAVKQILKIIQRTDVISFAGGLPAAYSFPVTELADAFQAVLKGQGPTSLQYGLTEGYGPLREWVSRRIQAQGVQAFAANVLITSGSQQVIDLICRTLINPGDYIAVENPTYLAAIQVFSGAQARLLPVPLREDGMDVDELVKTIKQNRPKLIYINPTFQNPTGVTMGMERRRQLAQIAAEYEILLIEDNPYGELRYSGTDVPAVKSFPGGEWVILAGTISKIIAPGLRVGWAIAGEQIIDKMATVKQMSDVLTDSLTQRAVYQYVATYDLDAHIQEIAAKYREQRDIMLETISATFPQGVRWIVPDGGMFIWVTLPEHIDTTKLLSVAIEEEKVAFVPGTPFYVGDAGYNTMRLNFSNSTPELIRTGISKLGALLHRQVG